MSAHPCLVPWNSSFPLDFPGIETKNFGEHEGLAVGRFRLSASNGLSCEVTNFGASLLSLDVPGADGLAANIVLGYESLEEYLTDPFFMGATVGRVANRIAEGKFQLGGKNFQLERNDGDHHLHGGADGWFKRIWTASYGVQEGDPTVKFTRVSPDGESGYPGRVETSVTYQLLSNGLRIGMRATSDAETLVNMAHHSYFNLRGHGSVLDHRLRLNCSQFTPGAPDVPDGHVAAVGGTPFDFRNERRLGEELPQGTGVPSGYDHNFLVDRGTPHKNDLAFGTLEEGMSPVAQVSCPESGRVMRLSSNQPCVQLYTGNHLDGRRGSDGRSLIAHGAFCLETQAAPNAIRCENFGYQVILSPGQVYRHEMCLLFDVAIPRSSGPLAGM